MVYMRSEIEPLKEELETAPAVLRAERSAAPEDEWYDRDGVAALRRVRPAQQHQRGGYGTAASARGSPGRR